MAPHNKTRVLCLKYKVSIFRLLRETFISELNLAQTTYFLIVYFILNHDVIESTKECSPLEEHIITKLPFNGAMLYCSKNTLQL